MTVSIDSAAAVLRERLGDRAYSHCERVARTAADLARIYGVDVEKAALAGLLHDWDKDLDDIELRAAAGEAGLVLEPADEMAPALLHARTGAAGVLRAFPDLEDEIVTAIARHTGAAVEMSELDMVVYIADMIEPERSSTAADDLREAVGSLSLDELFAEAYRRTMMHLIRSRKVIHPQAVEVWNSNVAREHR